jgi:transposase
MTQAAPEVKKIKYRELDRQQISWREFDVDRLIPADHMARSIWELAGRLDLSQFEAEAKSREEESGRPCWPARLLVSVWVYGYSLGIGSARAMERLMEYEPGMRWLCATEVVNHHTLSDFRIQHKAALEDLFTQFLMLLEGEGLLDFSTLLQDGTKMRAVAGKESYRRRETIEQKLERARQAVQELERQAEREPEGQEKRLEAAQRRAARERVERLEAALKEVKDVQARTAAKQREQVRVSISEPEAGKMKHNDGGWAMSYNLQVSTEARSRVIVNMGVSRAKNDTNELLPALERVKQSCGRMPARVVADTGYATRDNVEQTTRQQVELIAPWKDEAAQAAGGCAVQGVAQEFSPAYFIPSADGKSLRCPMDKQLSYCKDVVRHGLKRQLFEAQAAECASCPAQRRCCGKKGGARQVLKVRESEAMQQYKERMSRESTQALYKRRKEIAEFPHLWIKGLLGLRRFSVRGLLKVGIEAIWMGLAYNVQQWIRLRAPQAKAA